MTTRRRWASILAIPLAFALCVIAAFAQFFAGTRADLERSAYGVLLSAANQQIVTVMARLEGKYEMLEGVAAMLDGEAGLALMRAFVEAGDFTLIGVADETGQVDTYDGRHTNIADRAYFQEALGGARAIDHIREGRLMPEPRTILAVPLTREGRKNVLYGSFSDDIFASLLRADVTEDATLSAIVDASGAWIVPLPGTESFADLPALLLSAQFSRGGRASTVLSDLRAGRGGFFTADWGGGAHYACYTPLGINDWFLLNAAPLRLVESKFSFVTRRVAVLSLELLALGLTGALWAAFCQRRRLKRLAGEKERLRQSEERYRLVEAFSDSVLFEGDLAADTFAFNQAFQAVFDRPQTVHSMRQFAEDNPNVLPDDMPVYLKAGRDMRAGLAKGSYEFRFRTRHGGFAWHRLEYQTLFNDAGRPQRVVGKLTNVERQKRELERLKIRADQDPLTKLNNRGAAKALVDACLAEENAGRQHAFMIFDIDDFKLVNDERGHVGGDRALIELANVLRATFRATDVLGRLGGDEFFAFVRQIPDEGWVRDKAADLLKALAACDTPISISVGVAIAPGAGDRFDLLYARADKALYATKMRGKHGCTIYREGASEA